MPVPQTAHPVARAQIGETIAGLADLAALLRERPDLPSPGLSPYSRASFVIPFHDHHGEPDRRAVEEFARAASAIGAPIVRDDAYFRARVAFGPGAELSLWCRRPDRPL